METQMRYIGVPDDKKATDTVGERHEMALLFDVAMGNPNGDPDSGNAPRTEPDTLCGYVTDVCLKRKIRNFFSQHKPNGELLADGEHVEGFGTFIAENAVLKDSLDACHELTCRRSFGEFLGRLQNLYTLSEEQLSDIRDGMVCSTFPEKPKQLADAVEKWCKNVVTEQVIKNRILSDLRRHESPDVRQVASAVQDGTNELDKGLKDAAKQAKVRFSVINQAYKEIASHYALSEVIQTYFGQNEAERFLVKLLCENYFDVRAFGAVVSTKGPLAGSFNGQVRGPIQFTFARSLDKVLTLEPSITRCAKASADEKQPDSASEEQQTGASESVETDNRTMGRKPVVKYGLYNCSIHISAAFAAKTGFSYFDLDNFFFALQNMFVEDHAAGRHLRLVGLVDFKHTSALGNAPAHKLLDMVKVEGIKEDKDGKKVFKSSGSEFPQGLYDYHGSAPGGVDKYEPVPGFEPKNGEKEARIKARKLVWEIPELKKEG